MDSGETSGEVRCRALPLEQPLRGRLCDDNSNQAYKIIADAARPGGHSANCRRAGRHSPAESV
jgi:hypothetical protein